VLLQDGREAKIMSKQFIHLLLVITVSGFVVNILSRNPNSESSLFSEKNKGTQGDCSSYKLSSKGGEPTCSKAGNSFKPRLVNTFMLGQA
jgi:hypothetical protein